jgi:predicted metal-dependent phosphotriesterase family hydrolase
MATTTRREALQWVSGTLAAAMLYSRASAQAPAFPQGAVIRTLFKDYAPAELAGGATLFHEHLSLGADFSDRFRAATAAVLAAQGAPAAIEQLDILEDAGVDPKRVCIGHLGNLNDPNVYVHKTICSRGGFVGFDRQGGNGDANVVPLVIALLDAGFADRVLISGDASRGYARPVTSFLSKLKAAGADDATLQRIMVDNSRRFLAFVPKRTRKA